MNKPEAASGRISLLVSDIDGTLVTKDKLVTPRAAAAVAALARAGIRFTVVSSRPPRGMASVLDRLEVVLPFGGFNGGAIVDPADGTILEETALDPAIARRTLDFLDRAGVSAWVFGGGEWLIRDPAGPHVDHERYTIGFEPRLVPAFDDAMLEGIGKIVGVSNDHDDLGRCEGELQALLGPAAHAVRSQPYYLDVTNPATSKGTFVRSLARRLDVPREEIAVIGDAGNDLPMFAEAGFSIAMGNGSDAVKAAASAVTAGNGEEGFALAVETLLLPRALSRREDAS